MLLFSFFLYRINFLDVWASEIIQDEDADCETYLLPYDDLSVQLVNLQVRFPSIYSYLFHF